MATVFGADRLYFPEPVRPPLTLPSLHPSDPLTIIIGGSGTATAAKTLSADDGNIELSAAFGVVPSIPKKVIHFLGMCLPHMHCQPTFAKVYYLYAQFSAKTLGGSAPLVHDIVAMVDVVCALSSRVDLGRRWSSWTMEGGRGTPLDVSSDLCRNQYLSRSA